jgi:hypothetical protein
MHQHYNREFRCILPTLYIQVLNTALISNTTFLFTQHLLSLRLLLDMDGTIRHMSKIVNCLDLNSPTILSRWNSRAGLNLHCSESNSCTIRSIYDMIYLTAIGLTPGGSSTVHIYTQTIRITTQSTQTIHRTTQFTTN